MAFGDQLEVVSPNGELHFYDLDERDGVTNVGRHPSNNVVLNGAGIADFHLVIDHRSRPYQVSILHAGDGATIGNAVMAANRTYPLHAWETILLGGFALILMEGSGTAASASVATPTPTPISQPTPATFGAAPAPVVTPPPFLTPAPTVTPPANPTPIVTTAPVIASGAPGVVTPPATTLVGSAGSPIPVAAAVAAAAVAAPAVGAGGPAPVITPAGARSQNGQPSQAVQAPVQSLGDIVDETIVLDISAREVTIDVDNTATWQLTIANGGNLVARFEVHIEGWVDGSWVTIEPGSVNLFEGGRGLVHISVTPPRLPTSRAGTHQMAVVVTSPNYPGVRAQRAITLIINPYYDFAVGDVSPRQQTVNYFRRTGHLRLPIQNRGNSEVMFRLEGSDDENVITYEMTSPTESTRLVKQVEFPLAPNQKLTMPVSATPRNFQFIGVGMRQHSLTLTTTIMSPQQTTRAVLAQLRNRPIVGPWLIILLAILLAVILVIALQPRIDDFEFAPGTVQSSVQQTAVANSITAQGAASQAASLQGKKIFGFTIPKLPKLPKQLEFINGLWPGGSSVVTSTTALSQTATITQSQTTAMVAAGNQVTLVWNTRRASSLTLEKIVAGGAPQFLTTIENPADQHTYSFSADTRENAAYVLTAHNPIERIPFIGETFGRDQSRLVLIVGPVQPMIDIFEVAPQTLVTGQPINVSWQVSKAQSYELVVNGVPRPLDNARGSLQEVPTTSSSYQLVAHSPYWDQPVASEAKMVAVSLPTPVINSFDISPKPIVDGSNVSVTWGVVGAASVSIDPFPGAVQNLQGLEQGTVVPGKSQQTFTLLAVQGDGDQQVRAVATRIVDIVTPTPTPTLTPVPPTGTPTPTPTATPLPTPVVSLFDISPKPIIDGEKVHVSWKVAGASDVVITPVPGAVNLEGEDDVSIELGKSQETFTLHAVQSNGTSTVEAIATRVIAIVTPTPTITPTPTQTPTQTPQTPVIQVFTLSPTQVIAGDTTATTGTNAEGQSASGNQSNLPELTWTVVGDATMIEITAPDFGPVRNLPKTGTLRVPADKTTVYQLNVYLGTDVATSMTQELTVLQPTATATPPPTPPPPPTNTPTPTPTPTPNIVSFTVSAVNSGDVVAPVPSSDNIPAYQVQAGTQIALAWKIENPVTEVRLTDSSNDYGARSPEDQFQLTVTSSTVFQLTVTGSVSKRIRIIVQAVPPPPAPFNVNGIDGADSNSPATVTWDYPGESQNRLLGFRVYRADVDKFNFSLVADRFELNNTIKQWQDPTTPSCGRVYYVVGVWQDITRTGDDQIQETAISPTSWYTKPCQ